MIWKGIRFAPARQVKVVVSNNKYNIYIIIYGQEQKLLTGFQQFFPRFLRFLTIYQQVFNVLCKKTPPRRAVLGMFCWTSIINAIIGQCN